MLPVNVLSVEVPVSLVMMNIIVIYVLKTENTLQIVDVQPEPSNVVLLLVAHVTTNVSLVKENGTTVPIVLISETQPQLVTVHQVGMKKLISDVNFVLKNVSLVKPTLITVSPVEVSEKTLQIVNVHLDTIGT
jgi:hypothetical protein